MLFPLGGATNGRDVSLCLNRKKKHSNCHTSDTPIKVNHKVIVTKEDPQMEVSLDKKLSHTCANFSLSYCVNPIYV